MLTKKNHPSSSIAYHADDGKVFMGSGVGGKWNYTTMNFSSDRTSLDPFGPRCNKGDVMGCGVLFPRDFESRYWRSALFY